jgi:hypothetical protein
MANLCITFPSRRNVFRDPFRAETQLYMRLEDYVFGRFRIIAKKRLLASPCLSVCPHVLARLSLDGLPYNFDIGDFMKICPENPNFVKIWQKYRELYIKTYVRLTVAGDIKSP